MIILKKIKKFFKKPKLAILVLLYKTGYILPDKLYLRILFRLRMGKRLDLKSPETYSEKLQWLKLYNHIPEYTIMADKASAKEYVASKIGREYVIPSLGMWDKFDDIDFDKLPDQFVLKTTHGSTIGIIICKDKSNFNISSARKEINKSLKHNYFYDGREWPYKNIVPRIIAEQYMVDESGTELKDYKFYCFDGDPKLLLVATDRGIDIRFDFFDIDFNHLSLLQAGDKNATKQILKPKNYEKMVDIARKLSEGIPHVRVDLYNVNGKIYFGEMTFFSAGGIVPFKPEKWDYILGSWIKLPEKTI
ncbi:MAG: hypothetical protein BWY38_02900 [Ignavibacteria bacterium ADurb.Bin266]|nr:MAG: hypothetical protein BWY38_02900 [Ignavibacteria bacterium ADurb.Bin266]